MKLLYYPHINIPENGWLKQAILYSEKISSIVPFGDMSDKRISPVLKRLYEKGLYEPASVLDQFNSSFSGEQKKEFEERFIEVIETNFSWASTPIAPGGEIPQDFQLYTAKLTPRIEEYLSRTGLLIHRNKERAQTLSQIGLAYMSMLSDYIARNNLDFTIPSTDSEIFEQLAFQVGKKRCKAQKLVFANCLPSPKDNVSIDKVIKFRLSHEQELLEFTKFRSEFESSIANCETEYESKEIIENYNISIKLAVKKLQDLYGSSKIDFYLKSSSSLLNFKGPEAFLTATAFILPAIGTVTIGAGIGAVLLCAAGITSYKKLENNMKSAPVSLIYQAQKQGFF